jgi:hypothetical protein
MPTAATGLRTTVQGLFAAYQNATGPRSLEILPPVDLDSLEGQYVTADSGFPDVRDPVGKSSSGADFKPVSSNYATSSFEVFIRDGLYALIPDRVIANIEGPSGVSLTERELKKILDRFGSAHLADTLTALETLSATAAGSGTLALNVQADLVLFFNTIINEIHLATGSVDNLAFYANRRAMQLLTQQDQVQNTTAISGYPTASSTVRRTGFATMQRVEEFFATAFDAPIRLVKEDFVAVNSSGNNALQMGAVGYVVQVAPGATDAVGKTFFQQVQGSDLQEGLFAAYMQRSQLPQRPGEIVAVDAAWNTKILASSRGRKMAITLA